jgi:hypothetical protein
VVAHEYLRDPELPVGGTTLVGRLLGLAAYCDGGFSEFADLDIFPVEGTRDQTATHVAVEPLGLVEHETERPHEAKAVCRDLVEDLGIGVPLRLGPSCPEREDREP